MIPPYGIPALVGWYQYPYSPPVYHPIGKYSYNPPGKKPLARSIYWLKSEIGRLSLVPHNFGGVLLEMKDIPLDGVEALASTKTHNSLDPMQGYLVIEVERDHCCNCMRGAPKQYYTYRL